MAQVGRKHQELLERLEEENTAQTRLTLELYKAEGERLASAGGHAAEPCHGKCQHRVFKPV